MRTRYAEAIGAAREGVQSVNYLAHLYLAGDEPDDLIGNLMGDFVKGPVEKDSGNRIHAGILLHRRIDAYTDSHRLVLQSKRRIRPVLRRFAGILVDVYFDHFLARNWPRYSSVSLRDYSRLVYAILDEHLDALPPRMQRSVEHMIEHDLLMSYRELAGVERALLGIQWRLKRKNPLAEGIADLSLNYRALATDFAAFFPDLISFVLRQHGLAGSSRFWRQNFRQHISK